MISWRRTREDAVAETQAGVRGTFWQRWRGNRVLRIISLVVLAIVVLAAGPYTWTRVVASGHLYGEGDYAPGGHGPDAPVLIVLGAQVAPDGAAPMPFLRGRLDTAARLLSQGHAKVALVSGDANGGSGNETAVMTSYLVQRNGIDPARVVTDPNGKDTYDSCMRAKQVYGVTRALVVTQAYHLGRAVALCRHVGIDADGVAARCDSCSSVNLVRNAVRDYFACSKAALDAATDRRPSVESPPSSAVTDALAHVQS
jgi:vancomycin permeability regulator SanA